MIWIPEGAGFSRACSELLIKDLQDQQNFGGIQNRVGHDFGPGRAAASERFGHARPAF